MEVAFLHVPNGFHPTPVSERRELGSRIPIRSPGREFWLTKNVRGKGRELVARQFASPPGVT